jgi:hypothetical protein
MRRRKLRIIRLATIALLAGAAAAPTAMADVEVTGEELPAECAAWTRSMSLQLAYAGIFGEQADSYIAQREDYPCHRPITVRSLFHAGDPGTA